MKKKKKKKNIKSQNKIKNVLKVWPMCHLTFEGKIIIFKTLAISKVVVLSLISKAPTEVASELERIQQTILGPPKPKMKNGTRSCTEKKVFNALG